MFYFSNWSKRKAYLCKHNMHLWSQMDAYEVCKLHDTAFLCDIIHSIFIGAAAMVVDSFKLLTMNFTIRFNQKWIYNKIPHTPIVCRVENNMAECTILYTIGTKIDNLLSCITWANEICRNQEHNEYSTLVHTTEGKSNTLTYILPKLQ